MTCTNFYKIQKNTQLWAYYIFSCENNIDNKNIKENKLIVLKSWVIFIFFCVFSVFFQIFFNEQIPLYNLYIWENSKMPSTPKISYLNSQTVNAMRYHIHDYGMLHGKRDFT